MNYLRKGSIKDATAGIQLRTRQSNKITNSVTIDRMTIPTIEYPYHKAIMPVITALTSARMIAFPKPVLVKGRRLICMI